jgi:hypothetical protein
MTDPKAIPGIYATAFAKSFTAPSLLYSKSLILSVQPHPTRLGRVGAGNAVAAWAAKCCQALAQKQ